MRKHMHELVVLALTLAAFAAGACWAEGCRTQQQDALAPGWEPKPGEIRGATPEQFTRAMGADVDQCFDY